MSGCRTPFNPDAETTMADPIVSPRTVDHPPQGAPFVQPNAPDLLHPEPVVPGGVDQARVDAPGVGRGQVGLDPLVETPGVRDPVREPLVPQPPSPARQTPQVATGQQPQRVPVTAPVAQQQPQRSPRRVLLSQTEIEDAVGRTIKLTSSLQDAHGRAITAAPNAVWSTTDPFVASVKPNGDVALVNRGKCVILANMGGTMGSCAVTVH
jgi:hypothetical protein